MSKSAMGIVFANMHDEELPSLTRERTMASLPVAARYRMIDFQLSCMTNAKINRVGLIVRRNYHSLMDHLGNGREWDLAQKMGGLTVFPPRSEPMSNDNYKGRMDALHSILPYIETAKAEYVVLADCDFLCTPDYEKILAFHEQTGAQVTIVCSPYTQLPRENVTVKTNGQGRVEQILLDDTGAEGDLQSMNIFVLSRQLLLEYIRTGYSKNYRHFVRDLLVRDTENTGIYAYNYQGYCSQITDLGGYYRTNMSLLQPEQLQKLFGSEPIYTKVRDEAPTRYAMDAKTGNSLIADGCILEGTVENSVLFRGVRVCKGAVVRNCILMQGTTVEENVCMEYAITDKNVVITQGKKFSGSDSYPVYVEKGVKV